MKSRILTAAAFMILVGCKTDVSPVFWNAELDPYMDDYGYTISEDRSTIFKNGVELFFYDRSCYRCLQLRYLGPTDYDLVLADELSAVEAARSKQREDFLNSINVSKPAVAPDNLDTGG